MLMHELRNQRLLEGNYQGYLSTFGSHERLKPFLKIIPRLTDVQYWKLLRDVWTMEEVFLPHKRIWLRLLQSNRPCRDSLLTALEREALAGLPEVIEIWRGYCHAGGFRGLSWTLDKKRAEFFANYACGGRRRLLTGYGKDGIPTITEATCRRSNVLAYFTERGEAEIVVNPANVKVTQTIIVPRDEES